LDSPNVFDQKFAWVTGGSRGIGLAVSNELNSEGLSVLRLDSTDFDLSDQIARREWLSNQKKIPGVLVLNAGVNYPDIIEHQSDENFQRILETNLFANRDILLRVLPEMKKNKFGKIIIVSSLYATRVREGRSAYSTSKAGLEAFARSVAIEYAKDCILINIVAPGFVQTDLTEKNNTKDEILDLKARIPLNRLALPAEIAKVVSFMLSEKNTYMTGQTIYVDGGLSIK
jgi:3-oxoacyl-[acyl-carrier protein] reductase